MNGNLRSKLNDNVFVTLISEFDIICLSECWLNEKAKIQLKGYFCIFKARKRARFARRNSGGTCIFFKSKLREGIAEINWDDFEDGLSIKLSKEFFSIVNDICLIVPYLRPAQSSRNLIETDADCFDKLYQKIAECKDTYDILIISDFNARVGSLNDLINESDISDVNHDVLNSDTLITHDDLISNNMSIVRSNEDSTINSYGRQLIQLCKCSDLVILNGRTSGDREGKFTYIDKKGKSVIDLAVVSKEILYLVKSFKVWEPNVHSDHVLISLSLKCNVLHDMSVFNEISCTHRECNTLTRTKWKPDARDEFVNLMNEEESRNKLNSIMDCLDDNTCELNLSNCLSKLDEVVKYASRSHVSKVSQANSSPNQSVKQERWYDITCREKKVDFDIARKVYRETNTDLDKERMCNIRNEYRRICRKKRKQFNDQNAAELLHLSKKNPKHFWKRIRSKTKDSTGRCNFFDHFKNLGEADIQLRLDIENEIREMDGRNPQLEIDFLDSEITMEEMKSGLKLLKNEKSHGYDKVINEFMKFNSELYHKVLLKLFNKVLSSGVFPKEWAVGEIVPILKKGDINNPDNYRGITLISCMGKLFTSILNIRLNTWAEENSVFNDYQFGFRRNRSTTDCIFVLNGIIEHFNSISDPLYVSFVDLSKAFDNASRKAMWFKLISNGVSSKMIVLIKDMYSKIKLCIKNNVPHCRLQQQRVNNDTDNQEVGGVDDVESYFFKSNNGVCQGESLSPFLFSMFINDIDSFLKSDAEVGLSVFQLYIAVLVFADDMAVISETKNGLQKGLNKLSEYCEMWGLSVNVAKTQCVAFKKNGRIARGDVWTYRGERLPTVNQFKYLGFMFGSSGKHNKGMDALLNQSQRALFNLKTCLYNNTGLSIHIKLQLFKSLIIPILTYSSEIWGYKHCVKMDTLFLGFLKSILGIKKSTSTYMVYKELGVEPLINLRSVRVIKYWLKVIRLEQTSPVKKIYDTLVSDCNNDNAVCNWASGVRKLLLNNGFGFAWNQQIVRNNNSFMSEFKLRLKDIFIQKCNEEISKLSNNRLYKHLDYNSALYLTEISQNHIRIAITKLRLSSHALMNERGRWMNVEYNLRLCETCNVIEDEFHIVNECRRYNRLRQKYIPYTVYNKPSMAKFINFIDHATGLKLKKLGIFCHKVFRNYSKEVLLQ